MINSRNSFYFVLGLILIAAFSRIIPHYPNFTPLCAIALFGSKYFSNRNLAFLIPIVALWFSDVIINNFILSQYFEGFTFFYSGFYWQYGTFLLITLIGRKTLNNFSFLNYPNATSRLIITINPAMRPIVAKSVLPPL